jgi:tetratricopeptide (TPR) repeat protein
VGTPDFLEQRLYLPLIGLFIALAEIDWLKNLNFNRRTVKIGAALILLFFAVLAFRQSENFRDRLSFWQAAVKGSPHSSFAHANLGVMYYLADQPSAAETEYRTALALDSRQTMVHNNLGVIYSEAGDETAAETEFKTELALNPGYDKALYNLGDLYYRERRFPEALGYFQEASAINPNFYDPYERLLISRNQLR